MRWLGVALVSMLAACQPSAHRLLLLDMNLADPLALETTAASWREAGYHVEYRRFYPHLTRADLIRYRAVLILGGREPEGLSDALTIGDLAILNEWVGGGTSGGGVASGGGGGGRDGVVVLAYTSDPRRSAAGTLDRWIINHWLISQGAGIAIAPEPLDSPAVPLPRSSLDNAGFEPFPAGRNQALQVRNATQILARGPNGTAFVAASRVNDGLVVVLGRDVLASASEDPRTRDYLVALARWTRRPAEWANVRAATNQSPLHLADAPRHVDQHPPPLAPPAGATVIELPQTQGGEPEAGEKPVVPSWIARQGMRVLWSRFTPQTLESDLGFGDVATLNTLASVIPAQAIADTFTTRNIWRNTVERLQTTSIRWFPSFVLIDLESQAADEVDRHGNLRPVPCGLDSVFWRGALRSTYRTLSRLGSTTTRAEVIAGVAVDLDSALAYFGGTGFCDADYRTGLAALGLSAEENARLLTLPPSQRYDTLLERGFLARYFDTLRTEVSDRARALRAELRRLRPDLRFAFHADAPPADWFSIGLLQGFSSADAPVLLWIRERRAGALLARYHERGIYALSALRLEPDRNTFAQSEWNRLRPVVFGEHSGFWLDRTAPDSVARMIRRAVR